MQTIQTKMVINAIRKAGPEGTYGYAICSATELPCGTVYPMLDRLRATGDIVDIGTNGRRRMVRLAGGSEPPQ